ncbi:MAG: hypothetical protein LBL79_02500 [Prevotella sp.]|jgi:hypothetical protein|nr:hypothetical protein [Prevotella sp.]
MKNIRLLRADEIDVRVQSIKDSGGVFLLYKDARCDMRILDETFGITGWQRFHDVVNGNLFCTVEIWDHEKNMWIRKQDVGTESNTEKEKGEASDSFKRACFNIGIGRELYTSPFIWITPLSGENLKYAEFHVSHIGYNDLREIVELDISDEKSRVRFSTDKGKVKNPEPKPTSPGNTGQEQPSSIIFEMIDKAMSLEELSKIYETYPNYQRNQSFKNALTNAKSKLKLQPAS